MKATINTIHRLISLIVLQTSSQITNRKMPQLIPVRVVTKTYRANLK